MLQSDYIANPKLYGEDCNYLTMKVEDMFIDAVKKDASDIHLVVDKPPVYRIHGRLIPQGTQTLTNEDIDAIIKQTMTDKVLNEFKHNKEVDYSYSIGDSYRFRSNVFTQKGFISGVFRNIPTEILSLKQLNQPLIVKEFTELPRGLVLVTGPTGSGKSTTLAAMINEINEQRDVHIITIEDPIEFVHKHKKALINQREIGQDSDSFGRALKSILREDPDVILLGEMRDLETIATAVTLAETGHLVFATLHTTSAAQTVDRIIDVFPPEQQQQIRFQLSNTLEAVITQTLLPKIGGGRACIQEILVLTHGARATIRSGKTNTLNDVMQMGAKNGMQTLEQALVRSIAKGEITREVAMTASSNPDILQQMLPKGVGMQNNNR